MSRSTPDELLTYIFAHERTSLLAQEFAGWVRESRRYKTFAETYRDKIKRKYRLVRDDASREDLRFELATARLLLREDRFTVEYEKYSASRQRGPDYTVTFRTHTPFNVEVRRVRNHDFDRFDEAARLMKLMLVICDKVGQMPANMMNLLWLTGEVAIDPAELERALVTLRTFAERKAEDFFVQLRFESAAAFLKQYRNLSGIALWQASGSTILLNSLARQKLHPDILLALRRLTI